MKDFMEYEGTENIADPIEVDLVVILKKQKDLLKIESTMGALNTAWQAASEEMYKATQNAGGTQGGPADANTQQPNQGSEQKADGDVTDVDFEEVKEDKK